MQHVVVRAPVYRDATGVSIEIPVIFTEDGLLEPLVTYLLDCAHARSFSWMQKLVQAIGLLLDYMAVNQDYYSDPKELFKGFLQRLYCGTIGEDGKDPSGLYWLPKSSRVVNQLAGQLSLFSDWMTSDIGTKPLNPWREATTHEERLNWAAFHQKNNHAFLGHVWNRGHVAETAKRARDTLLRSNPRTNPEMAKYFPDDKIFDLLFTGFARTRINHGIHTDEQVNLRNVLITILMHFGGLRSSEPFHLFVHDVLPNPLFPDIAMVRVYHPSNGLAPDDWFDARGKRIKCNREAYLRGKYGMRPRTYYYPTDQLHAGWKGNALDSNANFMHVHWFPTWGGKLFLKLWNVYLIERALHDSNHPFAFVTENGNPYSLDSFKEAHSVAVRRIGLIPAKSLGTTPHGHRHAYGRRLTDSSIDLIIIKKALHHRSMESQAVYTEPKFDKVTELLNIATDALNREESMPPPDIIKYGFNDMNCFDFFTSSKSKKRR